VELPDGVSQSLPSLARLGYGSIDSRTIINFGEDMSLISSVLVANTPQPILSFLYFLYNGLFTSMLLGYEWSSCAHSRKGLRVSTKPAGAQRSTYFLSLPYRFSLPLMTVSGVLHWLVSQSIFLVVIDIYDWDGSSGDGSSGRDPAAFPGSRFGSTFVNRWASCGYSPIAIFTVIIVGALMAIAVVGLGFVPLRPGMSLAGSCSVAISAACHLDEAERDEGELVARKKLQWGVVGRSYEGISHCTFSSREVEMPKRGDLYAG
jgi:hypothetical protein